MIRLCAGSAFAALLRQRVQIGGYACSPLRLSVTLRDVSDVTARLLAVGRDVLGLIEHGAPAGMPTLASRLDAAG
jgi:hypothetical protein